MTNNVNYSGALLQAAAGPPANIAPGSPTFNAIAGLTARARFHCRRSRATTIRGAGTSGLAWDATPQLRLAASYRSEMKYNVSGNIDFTNPTVTVPPGHAAGAGGDDCLAFGGASTAEALYNRGVTSDIKLPQIANVSFVYQLDRQWELMGDVQ